MRRSLGFSAFVQHTNIHTLACSLDHARIHTQRAHTHASGRLRLGDVSSSHRHPPSHHHQTTTQLTPINSKTTPINQQAERQQAPVEARRRRRRNQAPQARAAEEEAGPRRQRRRTAFALEDDGQSAGGGCSGRSRHPGGGGRRGGGGAEGVVAEEVGAVEDDRARKRERALEALASAPSALLNQRRSLSHTRTHQTYFTVANHNPNHRFLFRSPPVLTQTKPQKTNDTTSSSVCSCLRLSLCAHSRLVLG